MIAISLSPIGQTSMKSDTEEGEKGDDQVTCHVPPTCPPVEKDDHAFLPAPSTRPAIRAHPSRRSSGSRSGPHVFGTYPGRPLRKQADGAKRILQRVPHQRRILTVSWEEGIIVDPTIFFYIAIFLCRSD